jgi:hypothetical protein
MNKTLKLTSILTLLLAVAYAAGTAYKLVINGKPAQGQAIVVNGQTYVPLNALKGAGVSSELASGTLSLTLPGAPQGDNSNASQTATGGANQLGALEGCIGQTLFNGVWRFKVSKLEQGDVEGKPGWLMSVEMRNAVPKPLSPYSAGFSNINDSYSFATADGNTGVWKTYYVLNDFVVKDIPQGGMFTYQFKIFPDPAATPDQLQNPPAKFILRVDAKRAAIGHVNYTVPDPSFRIDLTCNK